MRSRTFGFAAAAALALTAGAMADTYTFTTFNATASDAVSTTQLTGAPANSWRRVTIDFDWSAGPGDPYSEEAVFFLVDRAAVAGDIAAQSVYYAFGQGFPQGQPDGNSVHMSITVDLDRTYNGGSDPLYIASWQTFPGSSANWSNMVITLDTNGPPSVTPPAATDVGTLCGDDNVAFTGVSLTGSGAGSVAWYKFVLTQEVSDASGFFLDIDTEGASSTDTFIALYAPNGDLISFDDDGGQGFRSLMTFGQQAPARNPSGTLYDAPGANGRSGVLQPGTYYLGITRWSGSLVVARDFEMVTNATGTLSTQLTFRKHIVCGATACSIADIATEGNPDVQAGPDGFITGVDADAFIECFNNLTRKKLPADPPGGPFTGPYIADVIGDLGVGPPNGFVEGVDADAFFEAYFIGC